MCLLIPLCVLLRYIFFFPFLSFLTSFASLHSLFVVLFPYFPFFFLHFSYIYISTCLFILIVIFFPFSFFPSWQVPPLFILSLLYCFHIFPSLQLYNFFYISTCLFTLIRHLQSQLAAASFIYSYLVMSLYRPFYCFLPIHLYAN